MNTIITFTFIYPLTARVVWAPKMDFTTSFRHSSLSKLPSGTWWTPGLSIPWCCLPTSSSLCLVFFPLTLCLARWFQPGLMNGRHVHTTSVYVSLRWSGLTTVLAKSRSQTELASPPKSRPPPRPFIGPSPPRPPVDHLTSKTEQNCSWQGKRKEHWGWGHNSSMTGSATKAETFNFFFYCNVGWWRRLNNDDQWL